MTHAPYYYFSIPVDLTLFGVLATFHYLCIVKPKIINDGEIQEH